MSVTSVGQAAATAYPDTPAVASRARTATPSATRPLLSDRLSSSFTGKGLGTALAVLANTAAAAIGADSVLGGPTRATKQATLGAAVTATAVATIAHRAMTARGVTGSDRFFGTLATGAAVGSAVGFATGQLARGLVTGLASGTLAVLANKTFFQD